MTNDYSWLPLSVGSVFPSVEALQVRTESTGVKVKGVKDPATGECRVYSHRDTDQDLLKKYPGWEVVLVDNGRLVAA